MGARRITLLKVGPLAGHLDTLLLSWLGAANRESQARPWQSRGSRPGLYPGGGTWPEGVT
jgi:hypothetical protein